MMSKSLPNTFRVKLLHHDDLKPRFLNFIENMKSSGLVPFSNMTSTDYNSKVYREYQDLFHNSLKQHLYHFCRKWHCDQIDIKNLWFAQYETGGSFSWHTHEGCQWSGVYFLECPDSDHISEFYGIDVPDDLQEGDMFMFPSYVPHRGRLVTKGRKTVIAWNCDFYKTTGLPK